MIGERCDRQTGGLLFPFRDGGRAVMGQRRIGMKESRDCGDGEWTDRFWERCQR